MRIYAYLRVFNFQIRLGFVLVVFVTYLMKFLNTLKYVSNTHQIRVLRLVAHAQQVRDKYAASTRTSTSRSKYVKYASNTSQIRDQVRSSTCVQSYAGIKRTGIWAMGRVSKGTRRYLKAGAHHRGEYLKAGRLRWVSVAFDISVT